MFRSFVCAVSILVTASSAALTAESAGAASDTIALAPVQARTVFLGCGYQVGNPGSTTTGRYIVLRDVGSDLAQDDPNADYRIAMAVVYTDVAAASAAHQQAHRRAEEVTGSPHTFSNDNGPQLLEGYGGSVWRGNVALVQTRKRTLDSMYTSDDQTGAIALARPELAKLGFVDSFADYAVDHDFVDCLDNGLAAAAEQRRAESIEPVFIAGQPW